MRILFCVGVCLASAAILRASNKLLELADVKVKNELRMTEMYERQAVALERIASFKAEPKPHGDKK